MIDFSPEISAAAQTATITDRLSQAKLLTDNVRHARDPLSAESFSALLVWSVDDYETKVSSEIMFATHFAMIKQNAPIKEGFTCFIGAMDAWNKDHNFKKSLDGLHLMGRHVSMKPEGMPESSLVDDRLVRSYTRIAMDILRSPTQPSHAVTCILSSLSSFVGLGGGVPGAFFARFMDELDTQKEKSVQLKVVRALNTISDKAPPATLSASFVDKIKSKAEITVNPSLECALKNLSNSMRSRPSLLPCALGGTS